MSYDSSFPYDDNLDRYLKEIANYPLLTPEEEIALAHRIQAGDEKAVDKMVRSNLRLVIKIAKEYINLGLPILDLISEGNIGLLKAVRRFDPNRGSKLSTYAAWWIKQAIKRALTYQGKTIRLPVHLVDKIAKINKAAQALSESLGRDATDEEIAEELGMKVSKIVAIKKSVQRPQSLDATIDEEGAKDLATMIPDERAISPADYVSRQDIYTELNEILAGLGERERYILNSRFGLDGSQPQTLDEIGDGLGLTRERIRQLQNIAIKKIGQLLEKKKEFSMLPERFFGGEVSLPAF